MAVATKVNDGHEHVVAGADPGEEQRQVQRGRAARQGHGVGHTDATSELFFEHVHMGPQRRDPTGVEGLEEQSPFLVPDVGRREVHPAHARASGPGESAPHAAASVTTAAAATATHATAPATLCVFDAPTAAPANTASAPM